MDTGGQGNIADHGHHQNYQAQINQDTVIACIQHLLGG